MRACQFEIGNSTNGSAPTEIMRACRVEIRNSTNSSAPIKAKPKAFGLTVRIGIILQAAQLSEGKLLRSELG